MKSTISLTCLLVASHLLAIWIGSSLQVRAQDRNAHAHLSDVRDATELGEYFLTAEPTEDDRTAARYATAGIIHRILTSAEPGPNAKARLDRLNSELRLESIETTQPSF